MEYYRGVIPQEPHGRQPQPAALGFGRKTDAESPSPHPNACTVAAE